ncbi:MAG: hypothetical protein Kow0077_29000 [Anaerolineae bacterium]
MARRTNPQRLEQVAQIIRNHPGLRPAQVARLLGLSREAVNRTLASLEQAGVLLYEDNGRLWVYDFHEDSR